MDTAFKRAGIRHRDITFANIMFIHSAEGSIKGILNDWDHAIGTEALDVFQCSVRIV